MRVPSVSASDDVQQNEQQQGSDDRDEDRPEAPQVVGEEDEHVRRGPWLGLGPPALRTVPQAQALGAFAQKLTGSIDLARDRAKAVTVMPSPLVRWDGEPGRLLAAPSLDAGEELEVRLACRQVVRLAGSRRDAVRRHMTSNRRGA
jgi:hypothetical protein